MKQTKRSGVKKSTRRKKGAAAKIRYIVSGAVILSAIVVGILASLGPKLGLQTPPIEAQAMAYLKKNKLLNNGEIIEAYKAISYYTYDQGAVITNERIFEYNGRKVHSIPLDKISLVVIKNSELGHQDVMIAAGRNGVIALELYHSYVPKLIRLLNVSKSIVKDTTKTNTKVAVAKTSTKNKQKAAVKVKAKQPKATVKNSDKTIVKKSASGNGKSKHVHDH